MNEISWLILLLFLPFCLNMIVSILDGISEMRASKPVVVIQERIRFKERVVYYDRVTVDRFKNDTKPKLKPQPKPKNKPKNKVTQTHSDQLHDEVIVSLSALGVSRCDGKRLINSLVVSGKTYTDSESLLKDCINSL